MKIVEKENKIGRLSQKENFNKWINIVFIYFIYIFAILIQLIFDIYLKIYILIENIQLIFLEDKGKIEQKV